MTIQVTPIVLCQCATRVPPVCHPACHPCVSVRNHPRFRVPVPATTPVPVPNDPLHHHMLDALVACVGPRLRLAPRIGEPASGA